MLRIVRCGVGNVVASLLMRRRQLLLPMMMMMSVVALACVVALIVCVMRVEQRVGGRRVAEQRGAADAAQCQL